MGLGKVLTSRIVRIGLPLIAAVFVIALLGASLASAMHQDTTPSPGAYKGPSESSGVVFPASAQVSRSGSRTTIKLKTQANLNCDNGGHYLADLAVTAKTGAAKFSHSGTTSDFQGTYHYKLTGKFTKATSFKGTLSAKGDIDVGSPEKPSCTTGPITFSLFHTNQ
jgi:hypothetical protein